MFSKIAVRTSNLERWSDFLAIQHQEKNDAKLLKSDFILNRDIYHAWHGKFYKPWEKHAKNKERKKKTLKKKIEA